MSDSRRQYRAIKQAVKQLYPEEPRGNLARHLETLVFMVSGIIASKSCQLPKIASQVPGDVHADVLAARSSDPARPPGGGRSVQLGGLMARNGNGGA